MNEQEVMLHYLTKAYGKTEDEIKELMYESDDEGNLVLKEGVEDALIEMDIKKVQRIREDEKKASTSKFDDGYKKAQKEVLTKLEGDVKEKFGLETDKTGLELIEELTQHVSKNTSITEESLKTNPLFIKLEKNIKQEYENRVNEVKTEYEQFKESVERNKKLGEIKSKAKQEFLSLNPVLSEDPAKRERQIQVFLNMLERYDYIVDSDSIIVKNGEGRLEDSHGNPIAFGQFVKTKAEEIYDFAVQGQRGSPGNTTPPGGGQKKKITKEEYGRLVAEAERTRNWDELKDFDLKYIVV